MQRYRIDPPMRFFFLVSGGILWLGIFLTGWMTASWLLYVPAGFFMLAAVSGICPGLMISRRLFGKQRQ